MEALPLRENHRPGIFGHMAKNPPRHDPAGNETLIKLRRALGRVLVGARKDLGDREGRRISQLKFAAMVGLDQTTIAKQEKGHHLMRIGAWLKVAELVNVPFHELFKRAWELDGQLTKGPMRRIEALDEDEVELVRIWRKLTQEGKDTLMGRALACLELFSREDNVVPLPPGGRRPIRKTDA